MKKITSFLCFILMLCVLSCTDDINETTNEPDTPELTQESPSESRVLEVTSRKKKNSCTEYNWEYECIGPMFSGSGTFTNCINVFRGNDRIIGTNVTTTIDCLTGNNPNLLSSFGNGNCGGFVELYYRHAKFKYRVELTGGSWIGDCSPGPGDSTYLEFSLMDIGPDGRHDKDCLTSSEGIGLHKMTIWN
ncbi:MAG: hypothetical protein HKN68_09010, partial [Saprospiraceae bacterium]|nr:hypothetical protein [Saprospiraceae bacterium]